MKKGTRTIRLKWVHTSDVHGQLFAWDFVERKAAAGGLPQVYSYIEKVRKSWGGSMVLTDGGDVLQGQPTVYYANSLDPERTHWVADAMNRIGYDAGCMGNHDVETGHKVFDRWIAQCRFPILGANVTDARTGRPYLKPYIVLERGGLRIAVLGLLTPVIPYWQPETHWAGLRFEEMVECARRWGQYIRERERPHLLVGLFHSGKSGGIVAADCAENAALQVAHRVEGFDMVCYGHDHLANVETVAGPGGVPVLCMAPACMALNLCEADIEVVLEGDEVTARRCSGRLVDLSRRGTDAASQAFERCYAERRRGLEAFVDSPLGRFSHTVRGRDAYFGPSAFIDLLHRLQLQISGAQISLASPLAFDAKIGQGTVRVGDMFKLYRYEDSLCTLLLTGREIKGALELSYARWTNRMRTPDDHIMLLDNVLDDGCRKGFRHLVFNFDSAAGIFYTVDVTRPEGHRVHIHSLATGEPFEPDTFYRVTTNSHRASGGGELLTAGAGIPQGELTGRIVARTDKDLRHHLMEYIRKNGGVDARPLNHWRFVPEEWAVPACRRDRALLFGD